MTDDGLNALREYYGPKIAKAVVSRYGVKAAQATIEPPAEPTKGRWGETYRGKKRGGTSKAHEEMIERVCAEHGATRRNFYQELCKALFRATNKWEGWEPSQREALGLWANKKPDAFKIDEQGQTLTIFEVVKTHDCDPRDYIGLFWLLDGIEWDLRLEIWSHHGGRSGLYLGGDFLRLEFQQ